MEKGGIKVIEISPSSTEKDKEHDGSPRKPVFRAKNRTDMEKLEETEDCFILDFDPFVSLDLSTLSTSTDQAPDGPIDKGGIEVIEISQSPRERDRKLDGSPSKVVFRAKNMADMEKLEETEDCFILDFDPFDSLDLSKLSISTDEAADSPELCVIAEKGKVACRDYPHSRHLCVKYSFDKTPHESYCVMCYCYVCDSSAPCEWWTIPGTGHCDATEHAENWKLERMKLKQPAIGQKWGFSDFSASYC